MEARRRMGMAKRHLADDMSDTASYHLESEAVGDFVAFGYLFSLESDFLSEHSHPHPFKKPRDSDGHD